MTRRLATGRLCLELVSTVHGRLGDAPRDDLLNGDLLAEWLTGIGVETGQPPADSDLEHVLDLREAVYRLAAATATGMTMDARRRDADVALINTWARGQTPVPQLRVAGSNLVSDTSPPTVHEVLTTVARDAVDLLAAPAEGRLHQCHGNHCGTVFLDTSRGGRRRWCSSDSCGNRARVTAHRDRHVSS